MSEALLEAPTELQPPFDQVAQPATLDLAQQRIVVLRGHAGLYKLTTRRVTAEDWAAYYSAIYVATKQAGKDVEKIIDVASAKMALAQRVIVGAEGYKVAGDKPLTSLPQWQGLLPQAHLQMVGQLLSSVFPMNADIDETIYPEGQPVRLTAAWGSDEQGDALLFSELRHVLKTPTQAQYLRYARAESATKILGGSRAGTTVYLGAQPVAAQLYDELVVSVEGYTVNGEPLAGLAAIRQHMDTHHKFMAAVQVLTPSQNAFADKPESTEGDEQK